MNEIKVHVLSILNRVEANRDNHAKIVAEAKVGYRSEVERALKAALAAVRAGKPIRAFNNPIPPEDHLADYDTALAMLKDAAVDVITMDAKSYRRFVLDKWEWSSTFLETNARYSNTAAVSFDGGDLGNARS